MKIFKKKEKEKTQEQILKEMRTAEEIRLMKAVKKNAEDGKPESDNLIILKELSYHNSMDTEDEKRETEKSNRKSKVEKTIGVATPVVVMGTSIWNVIADRKGENPNHSEGGKRLGKMLDGVISKATDFKNNFKK